MPKTLKTFLIMITGVLLLGIWGPGAQAYHIFVVPDGSNDERLSWLATDFTTDNTLVCVSDTSIACGNPSCTRCGHDGGGSYNTPNDDTEGLLYVVDNTSQSNLCGGPYSPPGIDIDTNPYDAVFFSLGIWSSSIATSLVNMSYVCSANNIGLSSFDEVDDGATDIIVSTLDSNCLVTDARIVNNGLNEIVFDDTADGDIFAVFGITDLCSILGIGVPVDANGDSILFGTMQSPITETFIIINQRSCIASVPLPGTLVHEIGHTLGLAHSATVLNARGVIGGAGVPTTLNNGTTATTTANVPTMFFAAISNDGNDAILKEDDMAAATAIYPSIFAGTLGSISGTVLNGSANPILGAAVIAYDSSGNEVGVILGGNPGLPGNDTGVYQIENLPPGDYRVTLIPLLCDSFSASTCHLNIDSYFSDVQNVQFLDFSERWFDDTGAEASSDLVTVTAGLDTPNIDFLNISTTVSRSTLPSFLTFQSTLALCTPGGGGGAGGPLAGLITLDDNLGSCSAIPGLPLASGLLSLLLLLAPIALLKWKKGNFPEK